MLTKADIADIKKRQKIVDWCDSMEDILGSILLYASIGLGIIVGVISFIFLIKPITDNPEELKKIESIAMDLYEQKLNVVAEFPPEYSLSLEKPGIHITKATGFGKVRLTIGTNGEPEITVDSCVASRVAFAIFIAFIAYLIFLFLFFLIIHILEKIEWHHRRKINYIYSKP